MADENSPPLPPTVRPTPPRGRRPGRGTRRLVRVAWTFFFLGLGFFLAYPLLVKSSFLFLFGTSPGVEEVENRKVEEG